MYCRLSKWSVTSARTVSRREIRRIVTWDGLPEGPNVSNREAGVTKCPSKGMVNGMPGFKTIGGNASHVGEITRSTCLLAEHLRVDPHLSS